MSKQYIWWENALFQYQTHYWNLLNQPCFVYSIWYQNLARKTKNFGWNNTMVLLDNLINTKDKLQNRRYDIRWIKAYVTCDVEICLFLGKATYIHPHCALVDNGGLWIQETTNQQTKSWHRSSDMNSFFLHYTFAFL